MSIPLKSSIEKGESPEKIKAIFTQIQSASNKIESIIRRVMDFSKPGEPKFVLTDINQPIQEAIKLAAVTLRQSGVTIDAAPAQESQEVPHRSPDDRSGHF